MAKASSAHKEHEPDEILTPCTDCGKLVLAECGQRCLACDLGYAIPKPTPKIDWFGDGE